MKATSFRQQWRRSWLKGKDDGLGRERVGRDKFGNVYYQYYSYHGLPTRRVVLYKFFSTNKFHQDPFFIGWLRRQDMIPPTPEELEQHYLEHDAFKERALQWDKNEELYIREWDARKAELDAKYEERQLNSGGDEQ